MTVDNQPQGLYDPRFERDGCGIGAIVNIRGERTHTVVRQALMILQNLRHRGATGYDSETGDGAGIILQKPHDFLLDVAEGLGINLPAVGDYAVGMVFLPTDESQQQAIWDVFQSQTERVGLEWLGSRVVPVDPSVLGEAAAAVQPAVFQIFIGRGSAQDELAFNRSLYLARRLSEKSIAAQLNDAAESFHVASLSVNTVVYKGMLLPEQVSSYFVDLTDPRLTSALAAVHSRFSTNTFPAWRLAHPFRWLCHNGEINTIRGNVNWFRAREVSLANELFGEFAEELRPLIRSDQSDSACLDDAAELLMLTGRSVDEALRLLVPEAWQKNSFMDQARRAHCEYNATLMEPWDGPAALCFTDGVRLGVALDRSGLRPCRYTVTTDDTVILASEAGVLPIPADRVKVWGKLRPGEMLLIDTKQQRILNDFDLKAEAAAKFDYLGWVERHITQLDPQVSVAEPELLEDLSRQQAAFAYTSEELSMVLSSVARTGDELVSSMGDDTPLAVLSQRPRLLFDYFKQQFAQVTNPPIDPLREDMVMSLTMYLGAKGNLAAPPSSSALLVRIESPLLTPGELNSLERIPALKSCKLSTLFSPATGVAGMRMALSELVDDAVKQVRCGSALLVLSDRGVDEGHAAIPSVLAVAAVHHELVKLGLRTRADIIVESGEARSPHHFACLIGYGAAAVVPYLALASIQDLIQSDELEAPLSYSEAVKSFVKGGQKGLLKIMSKMGITTLQSYCGAQIFEAIGLSQQLVSEFFPATASRLAGLTFDDLARETIARHRHSFDRSRSAEDLPLPGGFIHYRFGGEQHAWSPEAIAKLQHATTSGSFAAYSDFRKLANAETAAPTALRHLLTPLKQRSKVDISEVEPASEIVKRFTTGAMSLGAISQESHEALAIAMNRIGGKSNTGEGGEDAARFQPESPAVSRNSAIKQVASGRFGVTIHYLTHAAEIQIKIAQGAKPGEGGQLPGHKVDQQIAKLRHSTPGVQLISPPPHHDIYSIEDLAQLIFDLKSANPRARVSVKLVSEAGIGAVAVGVAKAGADKILVAGDNGGTGASPLSSIKHAGAPWELGLAEVHQTLIINRLRDRVVIETDGQLRTGRDVVIAAALGADEFGFSTAPLIVQGCIMMRKCHLNTCPVGIATQDPVLRQRFSGKPEHVINYFFFVAEEVREWMADLGVTSFADLVGRTDLVGQRRVEGPSKARHLDLAPLLHKPQISPKFTKPASGYVPDTYDDSLLQQCRPALEDRTPVVLSRRINNSRRATGTLLSGEVSRRFGAEGLPDSSITLRFEGIAGQSFGAFLAPGITANLVGAANDYVGKGLSGGRISIVPPKQAQFDGDVPVVVGNTTLYGATSGSLYVAGAAGERFAVRNSGAFAVVEGVGDHGCEYMTGGVVVVLGGVGRNFAAGMSGGVAYVLDTDGLFHLRCNPTLVETRRLSSTSDESDVALLRQMIHRHISHTQSERAQAILTNWEWHVAKFVKIAPKTDGASASKKLGRIKSIKRAVGHEVQSHV